MRWTSVTPKKKKPDAKALLDSLAQMDAVLGGLETGLRGKRAQEKGSKSVSEVAPADSVERADVSEPSVMELDSLPHAAEDVPVPAVLDGEALSVVAVEVLAEEAVEAEPEQVAVSADPLEPTEVLGVLDEPTLLALEDDVEEEQPLLVDPLAVEEVNEGLPSPATTEEIQDPLLVESIESKPSFGSEPAWLVDLEAIEAVAETPVPSPVEEDELEDVLDGDPTLIQMAQEEAEELIPFIEACLEQLDQKKPGVIQELDRLVHTLKGVAGVAGAMRTRSLIHAMETLTSEIKEGRVLDSVLQDRLRDMFARTKQQLELFFHPPAEAGDESKDGSTGRNARVRSVRVSTEVLDRIYNEINEARLSGDTLEGQTVAMRRQLREMEDTIARISQLARDFEIQAESQIQSRKAQLAESHEGFDPLEMDRFTQLQEMSRLLAEAVGDVKDQQQDLLRAVSEQETGLAYQGRSIAEVQEGIYQSRLVVVDTELNDVLHKVALDTAREMGKSVSFSLLGGQVPLDRALLNRVREPLNHIIRNAVAHGIESPEQRKAAGKPAMGSLRLAVQKEAGRAVFVVEDDGAGLNVERIRSKAIEKKLWPQDKPMDARQAADVICLPGFSTAEKVSQVAGRGVGMDVVRNDVLGMGGRFDLASRSGRGLRVVLQIPTTVAAASVLMVDAGGETWSVPIEIIQDVAMLRGEELAEARRTGTALFKGEAMPFAALDGLMGAIDPSALPQDSVPILLLAEGERRVAVEAQRLHQVAELPLRTLGTLWSKTPGIIGATLLPDGRASFLVDPLRAPWDSALAEESDQAEALAPVVRPPMVLVVDDSVTVRKATARFLERVGFEPYLAKDGQEALEALAQIQPAAMLLDVEMPRMNGFDCARNVRENPRYADLPIIMITSRMAEKHRERAKDLGINEFLGKPFQEEELLALLRHHIGVTVH